MQVTANGTLQPTRTINIGSELSGTVSEVFVDINDSVKKGQVLVQLDLAKLKDQIARSRASLAASEAKVAQSVATTKEVAGQPRPPRGGVSHLRRQGAVADRTRHRSRHARPRTRRREQRACRRQRRARRAVDRRDQPAQGVDPCAQRWRGADAPGRPGQRGGRVAAGRHAVHAGRRPEEAAPAGQRGRGRRRFDGRWARRPRSP